MEAERQLGHTVEEGNVALIEARARLRVPPATGG
jgi:hypothetical protein